MKQIDKFVNSIYAPISGEEAKELKEEMRSHLLEAVAELKAEGRTEEEAISIAIERFGDEKQMTRGVLAMFQSQKKFIKGLWLSAIAFLVLGLVVFISLHMKDSKYSETLALMTNLVESYDSKGKFTKEDALAMQEMMERNARWFDNISYFAVIKNSEQNGSKLSEKVFVHGQEGIGESGLIRQGIVGKDTWYVEWEYKVYDYLKYQAFYYVFFAISAVLFALSIIVQTYYRIRLRAFP
ncbi:permease prefix domain 1-containing protein [Ammoniphilus sp. CFH 90114]|uniref:permease prefix domain 1-containing protein n=1 Tax=Ammoniphilus sp. CFH 90114 TaxID=2493665 RepID=UPI00100E3410|nr:permease prefix domain 1-containing protein [Ammoniphilus sp. CFH 90114]RXT07124.1 hypothetical protein EIZ39_13325 [Ammoniphilus sp. CFH 90114]